MLEEIWHRAEAHGDADTMEKASAARHMAKRMQNRLEYYANQRGDPQRMLGADGNWYKNVSGKWVPIV